MDAQLGASALSNHKCGEIGSMVTSTPRLCLWQRTDEGRRAVTFREAGEGDGGGGHEESKGCGLWSEGRHEGGRDGGLLERAAEHIPRPDFIQLSYSMKSDPTVKKGTVHAAGRQGTSRLPRAQVREDNLSLGCFMLSTR